jgi:hypothetical protein
MKHLFCIVILMMLTLLCVSYIPSSESTFDKTKPFEIISLKKGITSQSSDPDTSVCKNWSIQSDDLKKIIADSKLIDSHTWHDDFGVYRCIISGEIKQDGHIFRFEVNAGAWMYIFCPDKTLILGSYKKEHEKHFLSTAWDGN